MAKKVNIKTWIDSNLDFALKILLMTSYNLQWSPKAVERALPRQQPGVSGPEPEDQAADADAAVTDPED